MKRLRAIAIGLLADLILVTLASGHALLEHASPAVGAKVLEAPRVLRLSFSEGVDPALSAISVLDRSGKEIVKGALSADENKKSGLAMVLPRLPTGAYRVVWRAVAVDGHVTKGSFTFRVAR